MKIAAWIASMLVVLGVCSVVAGCGASHTGTVSDEKSGGDPGPGSKDRVDEYASNPARVFGSQVNEKNLLLADKPAAKDYLRKKLVSLLAADLVAVGFGSDQVSSLTARADLEDFKVNGHEEKVPGRGTEEGKIIRTFLWDVSGRLKLVLSDKDVAALGERFNSLPLNSMEAAREVSGLLKGFSKLGPDERQFSLLVEKAGNSWAGLLEPFLKAQLETPTRNPEETFSVLEKSIKALKDFSVHYKQHKSFTKLEKLVTLAAVKWMHTVEVKASNHGHIKKMLERIELLSEGHLPNLTAFLLKDLELRWRNYLNKLDDGSVPFPDLKEDFLLFLEDFPRSDFYPELELRFVSRWVEYLVARKAIDLKQLMDFEREVSLLGKRFPSLSQKDDVHAALGTQCIEVLTEVEVPDLTALESVKDALSKCDAYMPAGMDTMEARRRIEEFEKKLVRERDDRLEKMALKDLAFFIGWDKAINKLKWGDPKEGWTGKDAFHSRWEQGRDAGPDCQCTLDPDEPCRILEEEGPHGGFEVVGRFYQGKLSGVDLCQVYAGSNIPAIYRFFKRRYKRAHSAREATVLLSGAGGEVRFGKPSKLLVFLACASGSCSVKYRYGPAMEEQRKEDREVKDRLVEKRRQSRQERIERGWQQRDCVRWKCDRFCKYEGNVEKKKGTRYQVTISNVEGDPRSIGKRVWVDQTELFDCE